ncbi:MAG TPA: hypothetical protein VE398_21215 [Acidobacteriota bacterium]|nr:hypothetical protein [Acidobacteriota bacterium]
MGNYEQARRNGRQAVTLDPGNPYPERIETWFIVANASIALKDFKTARETLMELLTKLPPPASSDVALLAGRMLDSLDEAGTKR